MRRVCSEPSPFVLESSAVDSSYGRFSILGFDPVCTLTFDRTHQDPIERLANEIGCYSTCDADDRVPFVGGWVGFLSYEAGLGIERIRSWLAANRPA